MKPVRTWIHIADGGRARVLINEGPGKGIREIEGLAFEADHRASRNIFTDRPGRAFESTSPTRHGMQPKSDPHREAKRGFATILANMLREKLDEGRYDRLILVAPPATLGDLREELSGRVAAMVVGEVAKDLTKVPPSALGDHLRDVITA
jgi:protein required for attachment to host cells